jgi:hypothetical protein
MGRAALVTRVAKGTAYAHPQTLPEILIRTPWLLAIGQALRAGYAEKGESVPEGLAALVKRLEGPPSCVRATGDADRAPTAKDQAR